MRKRTSKLLAAGLAGVLAAATLLGGTFAWRSISQEVTNEVDSAVNPGGRLHDDFDGTNKDIYIENFTPEDGGMPIFARIRLYEYMETGEDSGKNLASPDRNVEVVGTNALGESPDINDPSSWIVHQYDHADNPVDGETPPMHNSIKWQMGGSTVYMPTFNMNKDSLAADINGTFAGPDNLRPGDEGDSGDKYDDYVTYTLDQTEVGTEIYDDDDNDAEDDGILEVPDQTHTAKATLSAKVMSMAEWKGLGSPVGNFWVYDTDGWAYWASAIQPGTATGLLLDGLNYVGATPGNWYYAIHVEAQMASAFDWGSQDDGTGFYKDGFTEAGKTVLENAAKVVVGADGKQYINCGFNTYKEILANEPYLSDLICAGIDKTIGNSNDIHQVVVLEEDLIHEGQNYGKLFLKVPTNAYLAMGPDQLLGTADDIKLWSKNFPDEISTVGADEVKVTAADSATTVLPNATLQLNAQVLLDGQEIDNQAVTWSLSGQGEGTTISKDGMLSMGSVPPTAPEITITATSQEDPRVSGTYTVTLPKPTSVVVTAAGNATTVNPDTPLRFTAKVMLNDERYPVQDVVWSVSGGNKAGTEISEGGLLTVDSKEPNLAQLVITATSASAPTVSGSLSVTVDNPLAVTVDDTEWYVMAIDHETDDGRVLLFAKESVGEQAFDSTSNLWRDSSLCKWLNETWLPSCTNLNNMALTSKILSRTAALVFDWYTTEDRAFLLSEADLAGTYNAYPNPDAKDYTYNGTQLTTNLTIKKFSYGSYVVRMPDLPGKVVCLTKDGVVTNISISSVLPVRPALWVDLNKLNSYLSSTGQDPLT